MVRAVGSDLFAALQIVRRQLDAQGLLVAVQGARRQAWASGMQRDMSGAHRIYLRELRREVDPRASVLIFGPVEVAITTVDEQLTFHDVWMKSRRNPPTATS